MQIIIDKQQIDSALSRGIETILPTREALIELMASGKRLHLYCGFDPTAPSLHIGHAMQLRMLRRFQDLGHEVIMLIGSFTAMIGDPTDKGAARTQLSAEQVMDNAKTWKKMAAQFLRFRGDNAATLKYNHKWFGKMTFRDVLELRSHFTVQQMMKRDMFAKRLEAQKDISITEFMYPLMQGYDSVAMDVDLEVGGNDQLFNMLAGRTLMKAMKQKEKFVLALKLLTNDEGKKMSKSEGGFIAISDAPEEMYGKIMAMGDNTIVQYFELVTDVPMDEVVAIGESLKAGANPRDVKMRLAKTVVAMFHGPRAAVRAQKHFVGVFQKHETPEEIPVHDLGAVGGSVTLASALTSAYSLSGSEARRQIDQGGVRIDGHVERNPMAMIQTGSIIQWGKRHFYRVIWK